MYEMAHVGLVVQDADRSGLFYQEVLGCRPAGSYQDERVKIVFLQSGTQIIELVQYLAGDHTVRRAGVVDHLAFRVADIECAVAALRERSVKDLFDAPKTVMGGKKIFFFAGPDGERLEFIQEAAN